MKEIKELVTVIKGTTEFTMPRENIKLFALYEALQRGITHGNIHDEKTSIEYLSTIGITIKTKEDIK
jgi:hypothetical protein